jgi:hypothetical protein
MSPSVVSSAYELPVKRSTQRWRGRRRCKLAVLTVALLADAFAAVALAVVALAAVAFAAVAFAVAERATVCFWAARW